MGYAIARASLRRGAEVALISGPSVLPRPRGAKFISVETAAEMSDAVDRELPGTTILIMSAAVSDFKPAERAGEKIEKSRELLLRFLQTPDILSKIGKKKDRLFTVGFAAETGNKIDRAKRKLKEKNLDMIVWNDVTKAGSGFDVDTNSVVILDRERETSHPLLSKDFVAEAILDRLVQLKA
jgi:phosphopantothenoylcysteine decarboxylase/phosphopantothenate--cysteine ligase